MTPDPAGSPATGRTTELGVEGVTLHRMRVMEDARGRLTAGEYGPDLPFVPRRYFLVFDVPAGSSRGGHAHRRCHQFLVCARGSVTVHVDDGTTTRDVVLDAPTLGIHVPPMVWAAQRGYSADGLLLVLASEAFDADDYVHDYQEFLALRREGAARG